VVTHWVTQPILRSVADHPTGRRSDRLPADDPIGCPSTRWAASRTAGAPIAASFTSTLYLPL